MLRSRNPTRLVLPGLVVALLALALARLCVGSEDWGWPGRGLVLELRLGRLWLAAVAGVALAASGVALQSLLRNPLAEPFLLGISTGAGVGMMAQLALTYWVTQRVFGPTWMGALVGAGCSAALVLALGRRHGRIDPLTLLLTGVVLSTINAALMMLFNYVAGPGQLRADLAAFMMGYLNEETLIASGGVAGWPVHRWVAGVTLAGLLWLVWRARAMDVASLSDAEAESIGVDAARLRLGLYLTASVLAAGAVVLTGPLAFVGLIAPHVGRSLVGPAHRGLVPVSAMVGAMLLIGADALSAGLHLWLGIGLVPIGVFTAVMGGVMFLSLLHRRPIG